MIMSRVLVDLAGELNFIGEPGDKDASSICCSPAEVGPLMDPEAVLFAGTGRSLGRPLVILAADTGS